jgi:hypothetical protein
MRDRIQDKEQAESKAFFRGTKTLEKIAGWVWGKETLKLTERELLSAADKLLAEADDIYPPSSLVTIGSPDIYLKLAFARSEEGSSRDKIFQEQAFREYESSSEYDKGNININEKIEIDNFNRHVLHGIKFIPSYVKPVFNRIIKAIDNNEFLKVAGLQSGSFADLLEDEKIFSFYIAALHKECQRRRAYLAAINDQGGVYQKLISLLGTENNVSKEALKQKLDMLKVKAEQIRAISENLVKLEDHFVGAAELLAEKRKAWKSAERNELYIKAERSKEQNEKTLKEAEAMSEGMSLLDVIRNPDISEELRLATIKAKLNDDVTPDPKEIAEAFDLAVKERRENIYLHILREEEARHSEKYLKNLKDIKDLNRIKMTSVTPVRRKAKGRIATIKELGSTSKALPEVDTNKALSEVGSDKPSIWSVMVRWVKNLFRALWNFAVKKFSAAEVGKPADQASDKDESFNLHAAYLPVTEELRQKNQGNELPKAANQASGREALADVQSRSESQSIASSYASDSDSSHAEALDDSAYDSDDWLVVSRQEMPESEDKPKVLLEAKRAHLMDGGSPGVFPAAVKEMSVKEQEINERLALIPEEERTRMLEYDAIGEQYLKKLEQADKREREQPGKEIEVEEEKPIVEAQTKKTAGQLERERKKNAQRSQQQKAAMRQSAFNTAAMLSNATRQEIQSVVKISSDASAERVMTLFLDHAMRIYLGHSTTYLAYRDRESAETFVKEFVPSGDGTRRGQAFKKLFQDLIDTGPLSAVSNFDNYLREFSTHMATIAEKIHTRKVVVTTSRGKEDPHSHREYKLAAVLAFLIGKRLLEKEYGSNNIPPEKLAQLMQAMAQHFQGNEEPYQNSRGQTGSYKAYMDLMAKKALELMPKPVKTEDVVENTSEKIRGPLSTRGPLDG